MLQSCLFNLAFAHLCGAWLLTLCILLELTRSHVFQSYQLSLQVGFTKMLPIMVMSIHFPPKKSLLFLSYFCVWLELVLDFCDRRPKSKADENGRPLDDRSGTFYFYRNGFSKVNIIFYFVKVKINSCEICFLSKP